MHGLYDTWRAPFSLSWSTARRPVILMILNIVEWRKRYQTSTWDRSLLNLLDVRRRYPSQSKSRIISLFDEGPAYLSIRDKLRQLLTQHRFHPRNHTAREKSDQESSDRRRRTCRIYLQRYISRSRSCARVVYLSAPRTRRDYYTNPTRALIGPAALAG